MKKQKITEILGKRKLEHHENAVEYIIDILKEERNRLVSIITNKESKDRDYYINRFIEVDNSLFIYFDEIC